MHEVVNAIGPEKTAFRGKAKLSAWQTWNVVSEVSNVFFFQN